MSIGKTVKAYCKKRNRYFALTVCGTESHLEVTGVNRLSSEDALFTDSEIGVSHLTVADTLPAPPAGGQRVVASCADVKGLFACCRNKRSPERCLYCEELAILPPPASASSCGEVGEMRLLAAGEEVNIAYADGSAMTSITVGIGWDPLPGQKSVMDIDSSVIILSPDNRERELVCFYDLGYDCDYVLHCGDNSTGVDDTDGENDENIMVRLDRIPPNRNKILFALNIFAGEERTQTLGTAQNLHIRLYDSASGRALLEYRVAKELGAHTALLIGMAARHRGEWSFRAIGQGLSVADVSELVDLCGDYI